MAIRREYMCNTPNRLIRFADNSFEIFFYPNTVEPKWLEPLWDHGNLFET